MFIADDVSARPPSENIRMRRVCYDDLPKPAVRSFLNIQLQFIHALEVEHQAAPAAINLEPVMILAAGGKACPFYCSDGSVLKLDERERGIVYLDRGHYLAAPLDRTLGDESLQ